MKFLGLDSNIFADKTIELAAAFGALVTFATIFYKLGRWFGSKTDKSEIERLSNENEELSSRNSEYEERFEKLEEVVGNPQDFWLQTPTLTGGRDNHAGQVSTSIPIISVVNFKGGVGKTTICANLAGYFASQGKRVLLIDFDYQGSLSDTVLTHARIDNAQYIGHHLIEPDHDPEQLRAQAERLSSINSNLWIYPSFYSFSKSEIQMMFRWLVGKDKEIRFNLHRYLQSEPFLPTSTTGFDIVLIDTAPRLLTGTVNAMAASTHVLIPTILDGQSHLATLNTMGALQLFRQKLNKNLSPLGIVPALKANAGDYNEREQKFIDELERQVPDLYHDGPVPILKNRPIIQREELAKAGGHQVVYLSDRNDQKIRELRGMFDNLGEYVSKKVDWVHPTSQHVIAMPGISDKVNYDNQKTATGS